MPNIFFIGDGKPKIGDNIIIKLGFSTVGSVWSILSGTGKVIAKARVHTNFGKDPRFTVKLFTDPRRDEDNPGKGIANMGKGIFGLTVEKTDDEETLY